MVDWAKGLSEYKQKKAVEEEDWGAGLAEYKKRVGGRRKAQEPPVIDIDKPPVEKQKPIAVEGPAPFSVHATASASKKPEHIIRSFASFRFPTLSTDEAAKRYYMKDGELRYIDNDGKERSEDLETGLKKALEEIDPREIKGAQLGAKVLVEAPPAIAAATTQYATGSPYLAAGAAGAARAVETGIAQILADREPEYGEMLAAGGTEAISSIFGDFIAKRGIQAFDAIRNQAASQAQKTIQKAVGEDIPGLKLPESQEAIQNLQRIAEENNIPLDMAQLLQSQEAASLQKSILQSGGAGAEILKQQGEETAEAAYRALKGQIEEISPTATTRYETGLDISQAAKDVREELVETRGKEAGKVYKKAYEHAVPVETSPVISSIDDVIENDVARGGTTEHQLKNIRGMLLKDAPENHPDVLQIDEFLANEVGPTETAGQLMALRNKLTQGAGVIEDRLKKLDSAKKEIGRILEREKIPPEQNHYLTDVINNLTNQMDKENPIYQQARARFAELTAPIEAFDKTILSVVRKLEGDNVVKAPRRIFSQEMSDPTTIKAAKKYIKSQNPEIWNSAVRVFMEQELGKIKDVMSGRSIAEGFRKRVWSPEMKDRMKAALTTQQYTRMNDYMKMVKNLGISIDANSDTALKQLATERRRRMAGGKLAGGLRAVGKVTDFLKGNLKEIASEIETIRDPEFSRQLAIAFTTGDKEIIRAINRLKKVNPKSEKYLRSFAQLASVLTGRSAYSALQPDKYSSPEDVQEYMGAFY